jgi:predicted ABC-type ATPase
MQNKKVRIFAGPNGSGKSTLINADLLEKQLSETGLIDLKDIGLSANQNDLDNFIATSQSQTLIAKAKLEGHQINIQIKDNFIVDNSKETHSYEGSFIAAFIRHLLIASNKSFSFETVMSHSSKINEIKEANLKGYKTYLYFVCIDNPEVNISRIANRVKKGGHFVNENKVETRYIKSLQNLIEAINLSYRAYLFDNSGKEQVMIAEIFEGNLRLKVNNPPEWFINYVLPNYLSE